MYKFEIQAFLQGKELLVGENVGHFLNWRVFLTLIYF